MSSGGGTSTQTTGLPPEYASILSGFGSAAQQAMNMPYQQFTGPRVANLSPLQQQSMNSYSGMLSDPAWDMAKQTYTNAASGSMNPYLDQVAPRITKGVTDAYNTATANTLRRSNTAGNLGSARAGMAQDSNDRSLATGLGDALGGLYSNAWTDAQNRALQGASGLGSLANTYSGVASNAAQAGNMQRGFDQQVIDANYGDFQSANNYPWEQLGKGANIFSQLQGGAPRTTTTTGPGSDPVAQGLGIWALGNNIGKSGK